MTKFIARIATGIAIIGLAAPALASTPTKSTSAPAAVQTSSVRHRHAHKKVASADQKKVEKKAAKKGASKGEKPAATPSATPAPASK